IPSNWRRNRKIGAILRRGGCTTRASRPIASCWWRVLQRETRGRIIGSNSCNSDHKMAPTPGQPNELPRLSKEQMSMRIWPGGPSPLGATCKDGGVNFALFSENAIKVELCLFDSGKAQTESHRITLPE